MRYQEDGSKSPEVIQIGESDFDSATTSIVEYQVSTVFTKFCYDDANDN